MIHQHSLYITVITRLGSNPERVLAEHAIFKQDPSLREKVLIVPDELEDNLSSTYVRKCLLANNSIKYLVPERVNQYLTENQVYTAESMKINCEMDVFDAIVNEEIKAKK